MTRQDLLQILDKEWLDRLFGFCYARTGDSWAAQDLCGDILLALVKAANAEGEIRSVEGFIWRVAKNVYADFSVHRREAGERLYPGDPEEALSQLQIPEEDDADGEDLRRIFRAIGFLSRAYREVMIAFYLEGQSTAAIAAAQGVSETAVRQRLFAARRIIRSEVDNMETMQKPVGLNKIQFTMWGTGNPGWGDPREVCQRQLSMHLLRMCMDKPRTAKEISEELNVPMLYVEEELDILTAGVNGQYGLLRRQEGGRYALNLVLLDDKQVETAWRIYRDHIPVICDLAERFISAHKEEYLGFPYLNRRVDWNMVLWQQVIYLAGNFAGKVEQNLSEKFFTDVKQVDRPYSAYGWLGGSPYRGNGWDGIDADNVCGCTHVHFDNLYNKYIRKHFACGHNVATDPKLQLAIRAIDGLPVDSLNEKEREAAANAIEEGYIYREDNTLYTNMLVCSNESPLFAVSNRIGELYAAEAEKVAEEMAAFIRKTLPAYLLPEYRFVNGVANMPVYDGLMDSLIEKGLLIPPKTELSAEGVWMIIKK